VRSCFDNLMARYCSHRTARSRGRCVPAAETTASPVIGYPKRISHECISTAS
jgi:hypothetical protein